MLLYLLYFNINLYSLLTYILKQKEISFHMKFVIWPQPDVQFIKQPSQKKLSGTLF